MEILVYDKDLNVISVIDEYESFIWNRKYNEIGNFELHIPLTTKNLKMIEKGKFIGRFFSYAEKPITDYFADEIALMEGKEIVTNSEGIESIKIYGSMGSKLLDYRVQTKQYNTIKYATEIIKDIFSSNITKSTATVRNMSIFNNSVDIYVTGENKTLRFQSRWGSCLDAIMKICKIREYGFLVKADKQNQKLILCIYNGQDRTTNQTNSYIQVTLFGRKLDNILSQTYINDISKEKNVAYVCGEGEGANRKYITSTNLDNFPSGMDRKEIYIDARDLQSNIDGTILTTTEYEELLKVRGESKLLENTKVETFESTIDTNSKYKLGIHYDLGDMVTIIDDELGVKLDTRIIEIQEIYEGGEKEINLVFGNKVPTILDKINNL